MAERCPPEGSGFLGSLTQLSLWLADRQGREAALRTTSATAQNQANFTAESAELAPTGTVESTTRRSKRRREGSRRVRETLHRALAGIEAIATETADVDQAVRAWQRLARGRWSLITEFALDGRRYYLVHEARSAVKRRDSLTRRERKVLHFVELGLSNKTIAYSLGVAPSTVSTLLRNARKKIDGAFGWSSLRNSNARLERNTRGFGMIRRLLGTQHGRAGGQWHR